MINVENQRQPEASSADNESQGIPDDLQLQYFLQDIRHYCELQAKLQQLSNSEPLKSFLETIQGKGNWEDTAKTIRWLGLPAFEEDK